MSTQVHQVDADGFDKIVAESGIAVVDFWATWCGPCRAFAPVFAASAETNPDIAHLKVDVDDNAELAASYGIQSVPTTVFIRDGIAVGTVPGALSASRLADLLSQTRSLDMDQVRKAVATKN